ncbi:hypothetical protein L249_5674 [Ophiocordyceps polyrhachis-furcata BCC 54312]|uniref:Uncharacterized protein n=1 Tax=Ophiocordyceps polyrhachis-furcata BCC 54312 TaxID=1330021 RepID=A0A367L0F7_9HYPO|nr:hypothetical protein L249_5674 [Ophiocordyceps polyrhachis-furcata BCC 54312]
MDEELTNREGEVFVLRRYVPYPAVSAVLRGVWVRIRPYL